jgi:hypothetical protein
MRRRVTGTKGGSRCLRRTLLSVSLVLATVAFWSLVAAQQSGATGRCHLDGALTRVPELSEGSGVVASRRTPGRVWALNDSGQPVLVALNNRGAVTGRVRLTGVTVDDWEAIALGPCQAGSCLYVGDIGDNSANRKRITLYRVSEPDGTSESVAVQDMFHATYPDGPHDAEALLITPKGDIFIVTKGETGPVAIYRFPRDMRPGSTAVLERVGKPREAVEAKAGGRITDGAVSPSGAWIVLRTNKALFVYSSANLTAGNWRDGRRIDLAEVGEPQGEGVAFADDTTLYLVGEAGGISREGTFARLTCTF